MKVTKRIAAFIMCLVLVLCSFAAGIPAVFAAEDAETTKSVVSFAQEYAKVGTALYAKFEKQENETYTYEWYVDGLRANSNADHYTPSGRDLEKFIKVEVKKSSGEEVGSAQLFCSKLPVVYINTENSAPIVSKDDYLNASLKIQGNDTYNSETTTLYDGATEIRGRGNSTWTRFPKKAYKLKLDKKTDLFSMGKNKHWVLIANYIDESSMRNAASTKIAKMLGNNAMDCVFVDVILNGESVGLYQLYEQVKISGDRVDIYDWEDAADSIASKVVKKEKLADEEEDVIKDMLEQNLSWMTSGEFVYNDKTYKVSDYYSKLPDSTDGGFLMEMDSNYDETSKFKTSRNNPIMFKSPEFLNSNEEVFSQIQSFMQSFEDSLYSADKTVTVDGKKVSYSELCDMESFVSYWLANEVLYSEFGYRSTYMSKDVGGPLTFGPVWDFDFSSNNVNLWTPINEEGWVGAGRAWFSEAIKDPYFAVLAGELYRQKASQLRELVSENGTLEQWYALIREAALNNSEVWPFAIGFENDFQSFKSWLTKRLDWIDSQMQTDESAMSSMGVRLSNAFSLDVKASNLVQNGTNSYSVGSEKNGSFTVSLASSDSAYTAYEYFLNGKFVSTGEIKDGKASFSVSKSELASDAKANVVTVYLLDENENAAQTQAVCVRLADSSDYVTATLESGKSSQVFNVLPGTKLYLPSFEQDESSIFLGYAVGDELYRPGEGIEISKNTTIEEKFEPCSDGSNVHKLEKSQDAYVCSVCGKSVNVQKNLISAKNFGVTYKTSRYKNVYTGKAVLPNMYLSYNGQTLTEGVDYKIEYFNNINCGFAYYEVTGLESAGYTGSFKLAYEIIQRNMSKVSVKADKSEYVATGSEVKPVFTLTSAGKTLVEGVDYTLTLSNNASVGTGKAVFTGIGNYTGSIEKTFEIKNGLSKLTLSQTSFLFDGKAKTPSVKVIAADGKALTKDKDYTVSYQSGRTKVGTYKVKVVGIGNYTGTIEKTFEIKNVIVSAKLSATSFAFDGKVKTPSVTVTDANGKVLKNKTDYSVSYSSGRKAIGTYSVKITGKGQFAGTTKTLSFKIIPGKVSAKQSKETTTSITLSWGKSSGATAYRVYSYNPKTKKYTKLANTKSTTYTVKKLKVGTKHYFAVKPYAVSGKTTYWGSTSSVLTAATAPSAPSSLKLSSKSSKLTIGFKTVSGATGYQIYYKTAGSSYKKLATTSKTSYTKALSKGKTYTVKVRAYTSVSGKNVYGAFGSAKSIKIK